MTNFSLLLVTAVAVVYAVATPAAATEGGWVQIPDINDPRNQKLGEWAVAEHNKQANDGLTFSTVVSGEFQLVAGINYQLVIYAWNRDGQEGAYKAFVYKQDWTNTQQLVSFGPAQPAERQD